MRRAARPNALPCPRASHPVRATAMVLVDARAADPETHAATPHEWSRGSGNLSVVHVQLWVLPAVGSCRKVRLAPGDLPSSQQGDAQAGMAESCIGTGPRRYQTAGGG